MNPANIAASAIVPIDSMTNRRKFVRVLVCGILAGPLVATAQTAKTVRRIGWLAPATPPPQVEREQQVAALRKFGWIEGQNLLIERRYANHKYDLLQPLADELVRLKVELIVAEGMSATLAARSATAVIPIVMRSTGDPVRSGVVANLARPGGNITGYSIVDTEIAMKGVALLRELLPSLHRVVVLTNPTGSYYRDQRKEFEQACRSVGIEPIFVEAAAKNELDNAVAEAARVGAQALIVQNDRLFIDNHLQVMRAALKHALPTKAQGQEWLEAGALISFDFSLEELRRRGAAFIDRILRGAKPADLPIEQPTQFELGVNMKTAKALGIDVPRSLLSRADIVIE